MHRISPYYITCKSNVRAMRVQERIKLSIVTQTFNVLSSTLGSV